MNKKIFSTLLVITLFLMFICSYSFAATNAGNTIMNAGNSIGNVVKGATNAVVDGARNLGNGAVTLGQDAMNTTENLGNDAKNTTNSTIGMLDNTDGDYTAKKTATTADNNMLGMSDTTWTWLILGIAGLAIVGLVWYYGAQYEHRNYNND